MKDELMKVLDKSVIKHSIVHHVLLQFITNCDPESRAELIESLRDAVAEILHTRDGSRVAMHCVWHGTQKDRKLIIRSMKTFVAKIAMEEYGHMVLLALFDCMD
ncbi:Pumilio domain-containing protein, partial [Stegodyphus mimosarum]